MMSMFLFSGCGISLEDEKCDEYLEKGIAAIEDKDKEGFINLFSVSILEQYSESDMEMIIGDMIETWHGSMESYKMQSKTITKKADQKTYIQCVYKVTTTETKYDITIIRAEDNNGLDELQWFNIQSYLGNK